MKPIVRKPKGLFPLFTLLFLFAFVAFFRIHEQGLLYHDAAVNLLEAKFLQEGLHILTTSRDRQTLKEPEGWEKIKSETVGVPPHHGKPGFNAILLTAGLLFGFQDSLPARTTAFFSILNLVLTFLLVRKISGPESAVYATALLASSVFYLVYARSGLADQVVTTFFLLGILFYFYEIEISKKIFLYASGASLGYAFASNQWRSAYMIGLFIGIEVLSCFWKRKRVKEWRKRTAALLSGFFTPLVFFQIPYWIAQSAVGSLPFRDYWAQLGERILQLGGLVWFRDVGELAREFWIVEGPAFPILIFVGWIFLIVRFLSKRRWSDLFLLFFSLVPFAYFSVMKYNGQALPRTVASILPLLSAVAGESLWIVQNRIRLKFSLSQKSNALLSAVLWIGILGLTFSRNLQAGITRSGYAEASRYLGSTGEKKLMILGMEPLWRFYLGRVAYEPYSRPTSLEAMIRQARSQNIRYVLVDYSTLHSKYGCAFTAALPEWFKPRAVFSNPRGVSLPYLLDDFGLAGSLKISQDSRSQEIYVFDIKEMADQLRNP